MIPTLLTIILNGALTRMGELTLDGLIAQCSQMIAAKSPDFLKKLESGITPETIEMTATVIADDPELKSLAQQVVEENQTNPYVVEKMTRIKQIGLENIYVDDLDVEIEQKLSATTSGVTQQTGATGLMAKGKATIKIKQTIE